jgi:hypothetical protein
MTWADGALALALGILGSMLAAYFYSHAARLAAAIVAKWAERSDRAARARLAKLKEHLSEVEELKHDLIKFVGWMGASIADMIYKLAMMMVFVVLASAAAVLIELKSFSGVLAIFPYIVSGFFAGSLWVFLQSVFKIRSNERLDVEVEALRAEIARIQSRLSDKNDA